MKKIVIALFVITLFVSGCSGKTGHGFKISITGTPGTEVSYICTTYNTDGTTGSSSGKGVVPVETEVSGSIVEIQAQKETSEGRIRLEIRQGGKVVATDETSAPYGMVTAVTKLIQQRSN